MKLTTNTIEETMISEAKTHYESSIAALRSSCEHALLAGLRLIWLHEKMGITHGTNQYSKVDVPRDTSTFDSALARIGIAKRTAYRWMNACSVALSRAGIIGTPADVTYDFPVLGTPKWDEWEAALQKMAEGVSINRLLLGQVKDGTEDCRMHLLISNAEDGDQAADALLQKIAEGTMTSAQAIRAAAGLLATKDKTRKDPVYLDFDAVEKKPVGLIPKAFVTLENGFAGWEDYDEDAKELLKTEWIKVAKRIPSELLRLIKVGGVA